ncbi:hypothetical protein L596_004162 [Steinernema carpocapsae]|uniref:Secreted protein n=1 Tax=Steinernema carpocapsae TaxID=34508 RepID=A0A4U8UV32_STECR|nr:hypothetical protein L596_004162 [Steinernema carpocapsae]
MATNLCLCFCVVVLLPVSRGFNGRTAFLNVVRATRDWSSPPITEAKSLLEVDGALPDHHCLVQHRQDVDRRRLNRRPT